MIFSPLIDSIFSDHHQNNKKIVKYTAPKYRNKK